MHGEYKTPGGKLVVVDFAVAQARLAEVVVSGDFFLYPEEALGDITGALEGLASVARNQTLLIATLSRRTLQERLLFRLVELADSNSPRDDGAGVTPKISQSTLAAMVGVTRENVNRALGSLAGDGVIRIEAGAYVLPDLERLRAEISNGSPMLIRRNRRIEFEV